MTDPTRVAMVGCGAVARHAHLPALVRRPDVAISALVDPSTSATETLAARFAPHARQFTSQSDMLAAVRPDVVVIASPGPLHAEQARSALEAGCHVMVEKPPADSEQQVMELARLAATNGRKLGAVFNYRYRDVLMDLERQIASGRLGTVTRIHVVHRGPLVFADAPWLWEERTSRYLVREFGIHFLDALVWLLGEPEEVLAVIPIEHPELGHTTDLTASVRFASGAIGVLDIAADSTRHSSSFTHVWAYGTGMDAFVRWFPPTVRLISGQTTPLRLLADELRAAWSVGSKLLRNTFVQHRNVSHQRAIDAYVDWVQGGAPYPLEFSAIAPTMRLVEMIECHIPSYGAPLHP